MAETNGKPATVHPAADPTPSLPLTAGIAVAVLVLYVAFIALLVVMRGDAQWDHLIYLLTGFEAIVFTAVGWVFGTTVARGTVKDARIAQDEARQQATAARDEAQQAHQTADRAREARDGAITAAERGRSLAASVKAKGNRSGSTRMGARPGEAPGLDSDVAELADVARQLFPD